MCIRLLTAFLFLAQIIHAQSYPINRLKVRGLDVGSPYSEVYKRLGVPQRWVKGEELGCYSGPSRIAYYGGLRITFYLTDNGKPEGIAKISVTSPVWNVSGVRVGDDQQAVLKRFSLKAHSGEGLDIYGGLTKEGYTKFVFKNGKLTKISWELNLC